MKFGATKLKQGWGNGSPRWNKERHSEKQAFKHQGIFFHLASWIQLHLTMAMEESIGIHGSPWPTKTLRKRVFKKKSQPFLKTRPRFFPIFPWNPVRKLLVIVAPAHPRSNPSAVVFYPFRPTSVRVAFSPASPMQHMRHQVIPKQDHFIGVAFFYSIGGCHFISLVLTWLRQVSFCVPNMFTSELPFHQSFFNLIAPSFILCPQYVHIRGPRWNKKTPLHKTSLQASGDLFSFGVLDTTSPNNGHVRKYWHTWVTVTH